MSSGAYNRKKGHDLERQCAKALRALYPDAKRGLQSRDGAECPDVIGTPFWVECKAHRRVNIQKAMDEAASDAKRAKSPLPPMVVSKDNGKQVLVTLEWGSFLAFLIQAEAVHRMSLPKPAPEWRRVPLEGARGNLPEMIREKLGDVDTSDVKLGYVGHLHFEAPKKGEA